MPTDPQTLTENLREFAFSEEWTLRKVDGSDTSAERMKVLNDIRAAADALEQANTELASLREALEWLVSLDEPGNQERRTVTMTQIIERARAALAPQEDGAAPTEGSIEPIPDLDPTGLGDAR